MKSINIRLRNILDLVQDRLVLLFARPKVSVILAVYNGEAFLAQALDSVFAQSYKPFEVIVVDDGSSDRTGEITKSFKGVRYFYQENSGPAVARNLGISKSKGDYIAFLDQDDLWTAKKLEVQLHFMFRHPKIDYVLAHQEIFIEPHTKTGIPLDMFKNRVGEEIPRTAVPGFLPGTLLARRSTFERFGDFNTQYLCSSDIDWIFRLRDAGALMKVLPQTLIKRRFHNENHSHQMHISKPEFVTIITASAKRRIDENRRSALSETT